MSDKSGKKRGNVDTARKIWLAGIGAYGRAFSEAQGAIKDMTNESGRVFDDLVKKGEMIETAVSSKRKDLMEKASVPTLNIPTLNVEDRIANMRSRLMRGEDVAENMSDFDARLSAIEAKLDKILNLMDTGKATTAKRKAASRKPTSNTAAPSQADGAKQKPSSKQS